MAPVYHDQVSCCNQTVRAIQRELGFGRRRGVSQAFQGSPFKMMRINPSHNDCSTLDSHSDNGGGCCDWPPDSTWVPPKSKASDKDASSWRTGGVVERFRRSSTRMTSITSRIDNPDSVIFKRMVPPTAQPSGLSLRIWIWRSMGTLHSITPGLGVNSQNRSRLWFYNPSRYSGRRLRRNTAAMRAMPSSSMREGSGTTVMRPVV